MSKSARPRRQRSRHELGQRLARYAAAGGAALLAAPAAEAAIRYSNPADQEYTSGQQVALDLDGTGGDDAWIAAVNTRYCTYTTSGTFCSLRPLGVEAVGGGQASFVGANGYANRLTAGTIGSAANFVTFGRLNLNNGNGPWQEPDNAGYLGVRFPAADGTHYAGIHLTNVHFDRFTLDAWAWEDVPDTPIGVGALPLLSDDFETGNAGAWSRKNP